LLSRGAPFLIAAALATAPVDATARKAGAAPGMIRGTVLDHYLYGPSVGTLVFVGKAQTTTDIDGRFSIQAPAGAYDIAVADPDRMSVTFYRGLRRRDPVLVHDGNPNGPKDQVRHAAHIEGNLSGGGFDPKTSNMATVYFFSTQAVRDKVLGGPTYGGQPGAGFGPLALNWIGPPTITGTLVAVRTTREPLTDAAKARGEKGTEKGAIVWWEAHKDVKVASGEVTTADLAFARLPMGHIAGRIELAPGLVVGEKSVSYYPVRSRGIPLDGDGRSTREPRFDFPVPDLRQLPGHYCASADDGTYGGFTVTMTCGIAFGATDVTLKLHAPPKLTSPAHQPYNLNDKPTISRDTQFAWTESDGKVYRLTLKGSPRVSVYTTATSTGWPDLQSVGVQFPKLREGYAVSVTAFGPYPGMDEAFSPTGMGVPFPKEWYSSESIAPYVQVVGPGEPTVIPPAKQVIDDDGPPRRR